LGCPGQVSPQVLLRLFFILFPPTVTKESQKAQLLACRSQKAGNFCLLVK
jgi:hypothetical protein